MDYQLATNIVVSIAVIFGFINERFIQKQSSIIIVIMSILVTLSLIVFDRLTPATSLSLIISSMLDTINFTDFVMQGVLSFLLFAGSLHIDLESLRNKKVEVFILATISTIASTIIITFASYYLLRAISFEIPLIYCALFGALISPTDPIAVLSMLKELKAPKDIQTTIAGESLFNDGVGIVLFITLSHLVEQDTGASIHMSELFILFLKQVVGGVAFGCIFGWIGYKLIKQSTDNIPLAILISIWIVTTGYYLAEHVIDISAPISMVCAGIFIGNKGKTFALPTLVNQELNQFWYIIDELLNSFLFLMVGLECIALGIQDISIYLLPMLLMIPTVLIARFIAVSFPLVTLDILKRQNINHRLISIITWGGLRGGLSIALVLSLPHTLERDLLFNLTYAIVIFSIIVQGLSIKPLFFTARKNVNDLHS